MALKVIDSLFYDVCFVLRMYLWWSSCTLYLHACQVRVTVGDSSFRCSSCIMCFKRLLTLLCVHYYTFTQPKRRIKMAALRLCLQRQRLLLSKEHLYGPMPSHEMTITLTITRPQIIYENSESRIKTHNNQHSRQRGDRKISNWNGSFASATIEVNCFLN